MPQSLEGRLLLTTLAHTDVPGLVDQVVSVYHDAVAGAPEIVVTLNGAAFHSGDQVRIAHAAQRGSGDVREVFVVDTNGYLRVDHLDSDQLPGRQDPFGGSVVLGPTMILNGDVFALRPTIQTLDIATPATPNGDVTLTLTGAPSSDSGPVPGLTITWTLTIPNTTPVVTPSDSAPTTVHIQQDAHFQNDVTLSATHEANAEAFRVARFSNSYVDAGQTTFNTTTHDADAALALGSDGSLLQELDLATVPRGALLVNGGVPDATEIQLQQRRPALLNDDPPNLSLRLVSPAAPGELRAQGFIDNGPAIDENSDNVDWYLNQQFASQTIPAGTNLSWTFELTAEDGSDLLPEVQFLHDQARQYTQSANPSDFGQPMIPVYMDLNDGGVYLHNIDLGGGSQDTADSDAFRGRTSYRLTMDDPNSFAFAIFNLERPRDIPEIGFAHHLRFAAKGDTDGQLITVRIKLPGDVQVGPDFPVQLTTDWSEYEIAVPDGVKASDVAALHFLLDKAKGETGNGTVRLDEIRLSTDGFDPLRVLQFYVPLDSGGNGRDSSPSFGQAVYRNYAFLYDNALAIKALLASGDAESRTLARNIADAILMTQSTAADETFGSFFDHLTSGRVWDMAGARESSGQRRVGDNAFVGLALLEMARAFPDDSRYYDAAVKISDWMDTYLREDGALGGYFGGFDEFGAMLTYRSTEHNLDAFEFHRQLAELADRRGETANAAAFRDRATHAGEFVVKMFDDGGKKFWTGTQASSDAFNVDSVPGDVQFWAQQTLGLSEEFANALDDAGNPVDYSGAVDWAIANLSVIDNDPPCGFNGSLSGFSYSTNALVESPGIVWFEGTAHAAVSFQLLGAAYDANRDGALETLRVGRLIGAADGGCPHDGLGVPAASGDTITDSHLGQIAFEDRLHVGASAWAFFATKGISPFQPLPLSPITVAVTAGQLVVTDVSEGPVDVTVTFGQATSEYVVSSLTAGVVTDEFRVPAAAVTAGLLAELGDGDDKLSLAGIGLGATVFGGAGNDTLTGSSGRDDLRGEEGADVLAGGPGNDSLTGGAGDDSLAGGTGDDIYEFDTASASEIDTVTELASQGTDTLSFSGLAAGDGVTVNLATATTTVATHTNGTVLLPANAQKANWENLTGGAGNDVLTGNGSANLFTGNGGNDTLIGANGNDSLNGGAGNDSLTGGAGSDSLAGGTGDDLYAFAAASSLETDTVTELGSQGTDTLNFASLAAGNTVMVNLTTLTTTVATHTNRTVLLGSNAQKANWENITGGAGDDVLTGNASANVLSGNGGDDTLSGLNGNDTLNGGAGSDSLTGGAGSDSMAGGTGDDLYVFGTAASFESDTVTELGNQGTDTLSFAGLAAGNGVGVDLTTLTTTVANHTNRTVLLGANVQKANWENVIGGAGDDALTGNGLANVLTGNGGNDALSGANGNDTLNGGAGNDSLTGGTGNDSLTGGAGDDLYNFGAASGSESDTVVELAGGGIDTLSFSGLLAGDALTVNLGTATTTVASHTNRVVLLGAVAQKANWENVNGGAGNDTLTGNSLGNVLNGNGGNDTIGGGSGDDTLNGGAGNDALDGGSGTDVLDGGAGTDTGVNGETVVNVP